MNYTIKVLNYKLSVIIVLSALIMIAINSAPAVAFERCPCSIFKFLIDSRSYAWRNYGHYVAYCYRAEEDKVTITYDEEIDSTGVYIYTFVQEESDGEIMCVSESLMQKFSGGPGDKLERSYNDVWITENQEVACKREIEWYRRLFRIEDCDK